MVHQQVSDLGKIIRFVANTGSPNVGAYALDLPPDLKTVSTDGRFVGTVTAMGLISGGAVTAPVKPTMILANNSRPVNWTTSTALSGDPDPKIDGTNIPIYRVSALLDGGMTVDEIADDFPSLTKSKILDAIKYAQANPPLFGNP